MNPRLFLSSSLLAATLSIATATAFAGNFSQSVTGSEITATGLAQLSSDQVASLDALVRRDLALAANTSPKASRPPRFSDRLSASERRAAGLSSLSATEIAQLDTQVQRFISAPPAPLSAPAAPAGRFDTKTDSSGPQTVSWRRTPEIHGSMSLMYGVGSHGYSESGGAMVVTYDDPNRNFSLAVGYSQFRTTGDFFRYGYDGWGYGYDRWGYYNRGLDPLFPYR